MFDRALSSLPELENSTNFSYFSKPEAEKPQSLKIAKTQTKKKLKIETWSSPILNYVLGFIFWELCKAKSLALPKSSIPHFRLLG